MIATIFYVCDKGDCPAQATHRFTHSSDDFLVFCDHHTHENEHALTTGGFEMTVLAEEPLPLPDQQVRDEESS